MTGTKGSFQASFPVPPAGTINRSGGKYYAKPAGDVKLKPRNNPMSSNEFHGPLDRDEAGRHITSGLQSEPICVISTEHREPHFPMSAHFPFFITAFISLFAIVDVIGNTPVFISITPRSTHAERRMMARKAALAVALILTLFALLGHRVFQFLGITLDAFRIAGGLILLKISMDMLEANPPRTRHTPEEEKESMAKEDVALIPMAMPMLSGPGAISTVIVLTGQVQTPARMGFLIAAILLNAVLVYLVLRSSTRVVGLFKETGMRIFTRILGIVLASIAIQFILTGIQNYFFPAD